MAKAELKGYLSLNSSKFETGLKSARKGLNTLGKYGGIALAGLSTGVVATTAALMAMVASTAEAGAEWYRLSQMTGISASELSAYTLVLEKANVDQDQFVDIMKKTAEMMVDAEQGATGAIEKLDLLGLSYDMLKDKSPLEQFEAVTDAMRGMEDQTKALGVAEIAFGDAGSALLPVLQMTKEELEANKRMAIELGLAFSDKAAKASVDLKENMIELKGTFTGAKQDFSKGFIVYFNSIMDQLLPKIQQLTADGSLERWGMDALKIVKELTVGLFEMIDVIKTTAYGLQKLRTLNPGLKWDLGEEEYNRQVKKLDDDFADWKSKFAKMRGELKEITQTAHVAAQNSAWENERDRVLGKVHTGNSITADQEEKFAPEIKKERALMGLDVGMQQFFNSQASSGKFGPIQPRLHSNADLMKLIEETRKTNEFLEQQFDLMNQPRKAFK